MPTETLRVEGLKDLEAALKELPKATGRNVIRRALTTAAQPIAQTAASNAPRGATGVLSRSIKVSKIRFSKGEAGKAAYAAAMKRGASRAEAAQAAHEANAENAEDVTSGIAEIGPTTEAFYAHFVEFGTAHSTAKPFMRPAYESNKMNALQIMQDALKDEIAKAVARIAKKQARAIAKAQSGT